MSVIYIASKNRHKVEEYRLLLSKIQVQILPLPNNTPDSPESSSTFEGNALEKAMFYGALVNGWVLADDSGLCVHAIGGEPGIFSARYSGVHGDDAANNAKLLEKLSGVPDTERGGEFVCSIALWNARVGRAYVVRGAVSGTIIQEPTGNHGFGYDPLFYVRDYAATFAELPVEVKNRISHRAKAVESLLRALQGTDAFELLGLE